MNDIDDCEKVTITADGVEKTYVLIKVVDMSGVETCYGIFTPPQGILGADDLMTLDGHYVPLSPKKAIKKIRKLVERYDTHNEYFAPDFLGDVRKLLTRVR